MKVVTINGSPKGINSNTHIMIEALTSGMISPDISVKHIFLAEKDIRHCKGCYSCWFKTPGRCVIEDDMKEIIDVMRNTDFIVLGSPLYFNNISGMLKVCFDRLMPLGGKKHKDDEPQSTVKSHMIMMSNSGFPDRSQFGVVSQWINKIAKLLEIDLIGEFYTTQGKVLSEPKADQQDAKAHYLSFLKNCGKQLAEKLELQADNIDQLEKNIIDF